MDERSFCDYPATLWTLQYRFRGVGTGFDADATADGEIFTFSVPRPTRRPWRRAL
jgi:hypothetical protein